MEIEVKIRALMMDPNSGTPIIILKDVNSETMLPIWVGAYEANAIALEIEKIAPPRPMTHDLLRNLIVELGLRVDRVVVTSLRDNTFYAEIELTSENGDAMKLDSRPSDAIALALRADCPIFVDLDPQGNSSISFLDPLAVDRSVYDLMMDGQGTDELPIYQTPVEGLDIVPARINLAKLESKLVGDFDAPFRLKDRIEPLKKNYKVIVIDTPPTLGLITVNALVASTHVLVPIQSSYFALEGTDDLLETIEKIKARPNPNLQLLGVVITMHDKRTTLAKDIHEQIGHVFGDRLFNTIITKSIRLEESPAYKESIFTFAPKSSGAMEYYSLSEEILSRV